MYRHVHQAKLRVVLDLFLAVKGHHAICVHASCIYKIPRLDKHTARAARRIKKYAAFWLYDVYDHLYKRLWRKENAVIRGYAFGKFV